MFDKLTKKKSYTAAMVREADLNKVEVPEQFEVLDADALARRLGLKRQTVQAYMARGWWHLIPRPNRKLSMGPVWYESSVRDWEGSRERG
jgi:predicted DNA-binding transcriptional regulator AlpA